MAFLDEFAKSDVRSHLKYGNIGLSVNSPGGASLGANVGTRFMGDWGDLELRMDSLTPIDAAKITGAACGDLQLLGNDPNVGDSITIQFTGSTLSSPVQITATATLGMTRAMLGLALSAACANNAALAAAQIESICPYNGGLSEVQNPLTEIMFACPVPFVISIVSQSGQIGASLVANGSRMPSVFAVLSKVTYYGYLPILSNLQNLIATTSDRLGIDKADVFTARKTEIKERKQLYNYWRDELADFLVIDLNPDALRQTGSIGSL